MQPAPTPIDAGPRIRASSGTYEFQHNHTVGTYQASAYCKGCTVLGFKLSNGHSGSAAIMFDRPIGLPADYDRAIMDFIACAYFGVPVSGHLNPRTPIRIVDSAIDLEIEEPDNHGAYFVLPSQLNGAEYPSNRDGDIVKRLGDYEHDRTGGPRGQLAVHPAVGQFLLDNAANFENEDGLNSVRELLAADVDGELAKHVWLQNGYLRVAPDAADDIAARYLANLGKMTYIAADNVPVDGYYYGRESASYGRCGSNFDSDHPERRVNLVYASAVPIGCYTNPTKNRTLADIAYYTLVGQYFGALNHALNCQLGTQTRVPIMLMLLGGGQFRNPLPSIVSAILCALTLLEYKYDPIIVGAHLDVCILTYCLSTESEAVHKLLNPKQN